MQSDTRTELEIEGKLITRYLVGQDAPPEIVERYVRAHATLPLQSTSDADRSLMRFIHKHPWSLPYLDAACAVLRRDSLLRNKVIVALALLEATPLFAGYFLPKRSSVVSVLLTLAVQGTSAVAACVLGISLYPFAIRTI